MRHRWEDKKDETVDEPVTITERQLSALKRGSTLGLVAMVLAVIAVALATWATLRNPSGSQVVAQPSPAPSPAAQGAATPPTSGIASGAPAVAPAEVNPPTAPAHTTGGKSTLITGHTRKAPAAARVRNASASPGRPVTESFDAPAPASTPAMMPTPMPVTAEPAKAPSDSSGSR